MRISEEEWKDIEGYEGLYQISNLGKVKSLEKKWYLPRGGWFIRAERLKTTQSSNRNGRNIVLLFKDSKHKNFRISVLVLEHFHSKRPIGMECCHKDGNDKNDIISNLKWGTHKENMEDMVKHGRSQKGEKCKLSKLKEHQVIEIRQLLSRGISQQIIAKNYGVTASNISRINTREQWV